MAQIDNEIKQNIIRFVKKIRESDINIQKVYLFGSFAKGTNDEWSDIDIAVISADFSGNRFDDSIKLRMIASDIDKRIEAIPFTPGDFSINDPLAWEIASTGVMIDYQ